jgi:hypothetical protein
MTKVEEIIALLGGLMVNEVSGVNSVMSGLPIVARHCKVQGRAAALNF